MLLKSDFVVCLIDSILMVIMDGVSELFSQHQALGVGVEIFHYKLKLKPFLVHLRNSKTVCSC